MMPKASTQVFETFELLEMILDLLPPRRILAVQRVCKTWQTVIARSTRIQHLLFRKSKEVVLEPFKIDPPLDDFTIARYDRELNINRVSPAVVRPIRWRPDANIFVAYTLALKRPTDEFSLNGTWPSYMDSYLTEPRCTTGMLVVTKNVEKHSADQKELSCSLRDPEGLKLGHLIQTASRMVDVDEEMDATDDHLLQFYLRMPVSEETNERWSDERAYRKKRKAEREQLVIESTVIEAFSESQLQLEVRLRQEVVRQPASM